MAELEQTRPENTKATGTSFRPREDIKRVLERTLDDIGKSRQNGESAIREQNQRKAKKAVVHIKSTLT